MAEPEGKRVSWVELYLDLIVVLAVGQLSHLIVADPEMPSVWIALGLFVVIWWTWIGFAVLYNRRGTDGPGVRLLFLVASVPLGIAAVAIEPTAAGDPGVFAASMAALRVVLLLANGDDPVRMRAYAVSAAVFALSTVVPEPWCYVLWGLTIAGESGVVLARSESAAGARGQALDPHHFAERFGLLIIILLGEVVVEAGQASADGHAFDAAGWVALGAAMVLAATLWWLYFDGAVELNLRVLSLSGGSPKVARAIFAVGHQLPAFGLLVAAAGVGLLLEDDPPAFAFWALSVGAGMYLAGTRAVVGPRRGPQRLARTLAIVATFWLGALHGALAPHAYLLVVTAWMLAVVAATSWRTHHAAAAQSS